MDKMGYLLPDGRYDSRLEATTAKDRGNDMSLDSLINQRTKIIKRKLDTFSDMILERLHVRKRNMSSLEDDDLRVSNWILQFDACGCESLYQNIKESLSLHEKTLDINLERRKQDTECWRDVVKVMRDWLLTWEAYEQAKSRGEFLRDKNN